MTGKYRVIDYEHGIVAEFNREEDAEAFMDMLDERDEESNLPE